jgi:hypothetical protein
MNKIFNKTTLPAFALVGGAGIGHLFSNVNKDSRYNAIPVLFILSTAGSWVPFFGSIGFLCGSNSYLLLERKVLEESKKQG